MEITYVNQKKITYANKKIQLHCFVIIRGEEYYFSSSLKVTLTKLHKEALSGVDATVAAAEHFVETDWSFSIFRELLRVWSGREATRFQWSLHM